MVGKPASSLLLPPTASAAFTSVPSLIHAPSATHPHTLLADSTAARMHSELQDLPL